MSVSSQIIRVPPFFGDVAMRYIRKSMGAQWYRLFDSSIPVDSNNDDILSIESLEKIASDSSRDIDIYDSVCCDLSSRSRIEECHVLDMRTNWGAISYCVSEELREVWKEGGNHMWLGEYKDPTSWSVVGSVLLDLDGKSDIKYGNIVRYSSPQNLQSSFEALSQVDISLENYESMMEGMKRFNVYRPDYPSYENIILYISNIKDFLGSIVSSGQGAVYVQ